MVDFGGYGFYVGLAFSFTFLILFLQFLFALGTQNGRKAVLDAPKAHPQGERHGWRESTYPKLPVNLPVNKDTKLQDSSFGHTKGVPEGRATGTLRIKELDILNERG